MFADGHLLLILHEPPTSDHTHRGARLFWRSPDGSWQSTAPGQGIRSLRRHVDEFAEAIERLERREEEALRADEYQALLSQLSPLVRAVRHLYATLQQAREAVREDHDLITCRDLAYAADRSAELLNSDVHNGLQCAIARRAEEQANNSHQMALAGHRLNLLAALFLPLATIASIFGMNFACGFEGVLTPWPFWLIVLAGILLGFLLRGSMQELQETINPRTRGVPER
jgi:Mg2+ and Co2+ transporter CorA